MTDPSLTASLLGKAPYVRDQAPYRLLTVAGPDAAEFLQRLCTQDLLGLTDGPLRPAAFLDAKGKLLATVLVFRQGETFYLETHDEQVERLAQLLDRYHFTERLTISVLPPAPCRERIEAVTGEGESSGVVENGGKRLRLARRGVQFTRWHGDMAEQAIGEALTAEQAECLRMLAGLVRVGLETEASTLALEADLDDHCSATKGCYTGQEIVARIHTYGHVNRKLCLLRLGGGAAITAPATLHELEDQLPVGRVMHAVPVPANDLRLGLGYLPTDFQPVGTKLALADGGEVEVVGF